MELFGFLHKLCKFRWPPCLRWWLGDCFSREILSRPRHPPLLGPQAESGFLGGRVFPAPSTPAPGSVPHLCGAGVKSSACPPLPPPPVPGIGSPVLGLISQLIYIFKNMSLSSFLCVIVGGSSALVPASTWRSPNLWELPFSLDVFYLLFIIIGVCQTTLS